MDIKLSFILEYMKGHDPDFSAEYQKRFFDTGNVFFEMLDWMNWIFD